MDVHTKEQRSYNMSRIKSENTKPEKILFSVLKDGGYHFSRHNKTTLGKPDAVIKKSKIAIFVDGEFWHGKEFNSWKDKLSQFWLTKIGDNIKRDKTIDRNLKSSGWTVVRLWGREIVKKPELIQKRLERTLNKIKSAN